jgi:putative ABC transport system permease protein
MIRTRWKKVWKDLWGNKVRTILVVSSIFIGVFSVGMSISLYRVIEEDLNTSYAASNPDHAQLWTTPFDAEFLDVIRRMPEIAYADARQVTSVKLRIGEDEWLNLSLVSRPELDSSMNILEPEQGDWPPKDNELYIERGSINFINAAVGDIVEVKLPDETIRKMRIGGVVHDVQTGVGSAVGVNGYVSFDTLPWLHQSQDFNQLSIQVAEHKLNKQHIEEVAALVEQQLKRAGGEVFVTFIPEPGQHPGTTQVLAVVAVIGALGILSVLLAGFLIFNTLSALLGQHVRQIGVMKAVGARTTQVVGMYLVLILAFCVLAIIPAIPAAAYLAVRISALMGLQFNYDSLGFRWVPEAVLVQIIIGVLIPILAGLFPIMLGSRITVHRAISSYGLGSGHFGKSWVDRLVESIRFLSRPILISIRNTFRRKGRLFLTLTTLVLGGAIFVGVYNLRMSMVEFVDQISKYFLSDVNVTFNQAYPVQKVEQIALRVPGVVRSEAWTGGSGDLLDASGVAVETVSLLAPPADSELIEPSLLGGRWIQPGDENAIVMNNTVWKYLPDLKPGDMIRLKINGEITEWQVVGFMKWPGDLQVIGYTTYEYLTELYNSPNRSAIYRFVTEDHSPLTQASVSKQLEAEFRVHGLQVGDVQTGSLLTQSTSQVINVIVGFFMFNAILIALVGAIGLTGTMSMNVLERTREIGVMRAIGASDRAILRLVMIEGLLIGIISWGLSALLAVPISQVLYNILSQALFQTPGQAVVTPDGFVIWFIIAVILSAFASWLPARNAVRLTVREILAYE